MYFERHLRRRRQHGGARGPPQGVAIGRSERGQDEENSANDKVSHVEMSQGLQSYGSNVDAPARPGSTRGRMWSMAELGAHHAAIQVRFTCGCRLTDCDGASSRPTHAPCKRKR